MIWARNIDLGNASIDQGSINVGGGVTAVPVGIAHSRLSLVKNCGVIVIVAIGGAAATGNISFGRQKIGAAHSARFYVDNFTFAAGALQGARKSTDDGTLAFAATADTKDERILKIGDYVTLTIAAASSGRVWAWVDLVDYY